MVQSWGLQPFNECNAGRNCVALYQNVGYPFSASQSCRTRTNKNADVRWTSACRRLDGGSTSIPSIRSAAPKKEHPFWGVPFLHFKAAGGVFLSSCRGRPVCRPPAQGAKNGNGTQAVPYIFYFSTSSRNIRHFSSNAARLPSLYNVWSHMLRNHASLFWARMRFWAYSLEI